MLTRRSLTDYLSDKDTKGSYTGYERIDVEQELEQERDLNLKSTRTIKQRNMLRDLHRFNQRQTGHTRYHVLEDLRKLKEDRDSVGLGSYVLLSRGLRGQVVNVVDANTYDIVVQPTGEQIRISGSEVLRTLQYV